MYSYINAMEKHSIQINTLWWNNEKESYAHW